MGRLSNEQITNIILAQGFEVVDINGYENKTTKILAKCKEGHVFSASLQEIERSNFKCPKCLGEKFAAAAADGVVPDKHGYRIVAFDQASNNIGCSIYDDGVLVYYALYQLIGELEERLAKWFTFLNDDVIKNWQPDYIMFEDIQYQQQAGVITFKTLAEVLGIGKLAAQLNGIEHSSVLNKTWQSEFYISGSNRVAQKRNVVERVKEYFNIDVTDDVGDAILIGRYAANKLNSKWGSSSF